MSDASTSSEHVVDPHMSDHPTPRKYVNIAIILAIVTALEVAVYYISMADSLLITVLAIMAFIKFVMVVAYFMHLRFDSNIFRRLFVTGVILAFFVFGIVMLLFFSSGGPAPASGS